MDNITYSIQRRTQADTATTDKWIAQQHLSQSQFADMDLATCLLQAKQIATNLLKYHAKLLEQNQAHTLNNYLQAMNHQKKRNKLTVAQAHKVMNIGTQANRKLFKQHRQQK